MLIAGQCTPHFLFHLVEKKTGRARSKRKDRLDALRRVRASARRGSADRCKRRFWPAFGHAMAFCEVDTAVPWRMVRRSSGCKDAFDQLLFPRVSLRYALPGARRSCCVGPCCSFHQPPASGSENRRRVYPCTSPGWRFPQGPDVSVPDRRKGQPTFPRRRQEVCACADRPAEAFFLFGPCTARFSFGKTKREMGGAFPSYQHS